MTPKEIYIHHSLTKDGTTVSWGAIRHYHMTAPEYMMKDIGYHAGVELVKSGDYEYYEILMGRMWDEMGAHAKGHNYESLGLCFVGNYDDYVPPAAMLEKGAQQVRFWMRLYNIPIVGVRRHSEVSEKTCPGKLFPWGDFIDLCRR